MFQIKGDVKQAAAMNDEAIRKFPLATIVVVFYGAVGKALAYLL